MPFANHERLILSLSPEARKAMDEISSLYGGISDSDVIRYALGTELTILRERNKGTRILLKKRFGRFRELFWPFLSMSK